jgi:hypothetical protein
MPSSNDVNTYQMTQWHNDDQNDVLPQWSNGAVHYQMTYTSVKRSRRHNGTMSPINMTQWPIWLWHNDHMTRKQNIKNIRIFIKLTKQTHCSVAMYPSVSCYSRTLCHIWHIVCWQRAVCVGVDVVVVVYHGTAPVPPLTDADTYWAQQDELDDVRILNVYPKPDLHPHCQLHPHPQGVHNVT